MKISHVTCFSSLTVIPQASCPRRGLVYPLPSSGSRTIAALCNLTRRFLPLNLLLCRSSTRTKRTIMEKAKAFDKMSILFDFDGTIGDTETPAMEVAFWELAPYLVDTGESNSLTQCWCTAPFVCMYLDESEGRTTPITYGIFEIRELYLYCREQLSLSAPVRKGFKQCRITSSSKKLGKSVVECCVDGVCSFLRTGLSAVPR